MFLYACIYFILHLEYPRKQQIGMQTEVFISFSHPDIYLSPPATLQSLSLDGAVCVFT